MGCTGCGGSDGGPDTGPTSPTSVAATSAEPTADAAPDDAATTLPPGAQPGLDDYDGDGQPDPTCDTQDFGGGLVLRIPCEIGTANEPESGSRLVDGSLYRLPGSTDIDLTGISGSLLLARDTAGVKVVIVVFNSDNLFATGSDAIGSTDTMDNTIKLINSRFPGGKIQVRGHTDSTGTAGANQALSERRAGAVRAYLLDHRVNATEVTAVGMGSTRPLAENANPDGSPDPEGQAFNRRVELVLRLPNG
ncbi:flagellar motor protein MotB [Pseudofrankia sp. BMG5.36]|nr:flagellar motor protein MotB [Pseudofrankia sp. BMG5.36]